MNRLRYASLVMAGLLLPCAAIPRPALASEDAAGTAAAAAAGEAMAAEQPSVDELIARHAEWLGGAPALDRIHTLRMEARLEVSGLAGSLRSLQLRDGRQRTDYDLGAVRGAYVVTPDTAWTIDTAGRIEPMGLREAATSRRGLARTFGAHLAGADGSSRQDLGVEEHHGRPWRVVRYSYRDGDAFDLFLDPVTGASEWRRERRDTETYWTHLEDFRMVDGARFPFRSSEVHANPAANQVVTIDRIELNGTAADTDFLPPPAPKKLYALDAGTATEWMPMELFRGAYIYLRGSINGAETDILLDSGAGMTVLDQTFAAARGVASAGEVVAKGTVGESRASFARGITLRVGGLELRDLTAAVIDLEVIAARLGRPMPVILGKEVFQSLIVDVDYPGRRIRFVEPDSFRYEGPGRRLPVHAAEGGHREIEISVEGLPPALVGLDTGAGTSLDLFGWYVDENRLLEGRAPVSEGLTGGVGGMATETLTTLREVTIAGYALRAVPIGISRATTGAFATRQTAGNLGAGILKRFRVVFDYAHGCLWLEPRPGTESDPFERNRSGLAFERKDGALEVVMVAPGSPAEAAQWKTGERIVAVDGTPVGPGYSEAVDRFGQRPDGTEVRLRLDDGSERTLRLSSYY